MILYALPTRSTSLAAAKQHIAALEQAGLQVEPLARVGVLAILRARRVSHRTIIACEPNDARALLAAWLVGVPLRIAMGKGRWHARIFATHESLDAQALASIVAEHHEGLSSQAGLPLCLKRMLDLSLAVPVLLVTLPVTFGTAVAVRIWLGSPVLFRQARPGKHGRIFRIYKFRTMTDARDAEGNLLPDAERLTRFGKWLRATSVDELPQLLNVVRGQMSLVGPRPLLTSYLDRYSPEQRRRHNVLPGITGLAQVNGRNATTWDERLRWDVQYADNWSLPRDLVILLQTVRAVLRRSGVSQPGHATMPEFTGKGAGLTPGARAAT